MTVPTEKDCSLCEVCDDTGFVDDLDNDGGSVKCEWCPSPENVEEPT